jgi:hypothetical protein
MLPRLSRAPIPCPVMRSSRPRQVQAPCPSRRPSLAVPRLRQLRRSCRPLHLGGFDRAAGPPLPGRVQHQLERRVGDGEVGVTGPRLGRCGAG